MPVREGAEYGINFVNFTSVKKVDAIMRLKKIGIILGTIVLVAVLILVFILLNLDAFLLVGFACFLVFVAFFVFVLWKYTCIEYNYIISGGEFTMSIDYAGRKQKKIFSKRVAEFDFIAPKTEENLAAAHASEADITYFCAASENEPYMWFVTFKDEAGKKCICIFDSCKKTEVALKYYNSSAFHSK